MFKLYQSLVLIGLLSIIDLVTTEISLRSQYKINKNDPYDAGKILINSNRVTGVFLLLLGLLVVWLAQIIAGSNLPIFSLVLLLMLVLRFLLSMILYKFCVNRKKAKKENEVRQDLANMQNTIVNGDSNKAKEILKKHYNGK